MIGKACGKIEQKLEYRVSGAAASKRACHETTSNASFDLDFAKKQHDLHKVLPFKTGLNPLESGNYWQKSRKRPNSFIFMNSLGAIFSAPLFQ